MNQQLLNVRTQLLIIRLRRGDKEAFVTLVNLWERRLFYFIRRIVCQEDDAWDVLQETWLKVHTRIRQLREAEAFPAWLYRVARHAAINHLRREQRQELLQEDVQQNIPDQVGNCRFSEEQAELVHWGLDQLPLPQREALTLFFLEGFSLNEIAGIAQVSTGTVKSRLHYGKQTLREIMEREECSHE
jgi:RNA polymerase sigma-70 factor (ECF subfamily)